MMTTHIIIDPDVLVEVLENEEGDVSLYYNFKVKELIDNALNSTLLSGDEIMLHLLIDPDERKNNQFLKYYQSIKFDVLNLESIYETIREFGYKFSTVPIILNRDEEKSFIFKQDDIETQLSKSQLHTITPEQYIFITLDDKFYTLLTKEFCQGIRLYNTGEINIYNLSQFNNLDLNKYSSKESYVDIDGTALLRVPTIINKTTTINPSINIILDKMGKNSPIKFLTARPDLKILLIKLNKDIKKLKFYKDFIKNSMIKFNDTVDNINIGNVNSFNEQEFELLSSFADIVKKAEELEENVNITFEGLSIYNNAMITSICSPNFIAKKYKEQYNINIEVDYKLFTNFSFNGKYKSEVLFNYVKANIINKEKKEKTLIVFLDDNSEELIKMHSDKKLFKDEFGITLLPIKIHYRGDFDEDHINTLRKFLIISNEYQCINNEIEYISSDNDEESLNVEEVQSMIFQQIIHSNWLSSDICFFSSQQSDNSTLKSENKKNIAPLSNPF